jgi:dihydroorotase-like cyclic amidohydrolase
MIYTVTLDFAEGPSYSHVAQAVSEIFAIEQAKKLASYAGFEGHITKISCVQDVPVVRY